MKTLIKFRTTTSRLFVLFALGGLALSPKVSASGGPPSNCNTSEGYQALFNVTTGFDDTAFGGRALYSDTSGSDNTAVGCGALVGNTTGNHNTATGSQALSRNTSADDNTANGYRALYNNTGGGGNTASGVEALLSNTIGYNNTATGFHALFSNTNGLSNVAMGFQALSNNTSGDGNIGLGSFAGANVNTAGGVICIGAPGANVDNSCYIGNIFGQTSFEGVGVFVNSDGKLGTSLSSRRFKKDIQAMDKASEAILALKPVTFHYKADSKRTAQCGLIAEDVAKVNPDLVVRDGNGEIYTVRYDAVNAMLLNEFLKEHQKVEDQDRKLTEQQATIAQLRKDLQATGAQQQKEIEALTAGLQKVSAQMGLSKGAPQTVSNNQ